VAAESGATSAIGSGLDALRLAFVMPTTGADSTTEPHSWHSPQRPTHFEVVQPHALQTYVGRASRERERPAGPVVTRQTLGQAADSRVPAVVAASREATSAGEAGTRGSGAS
jgi:hypothetical protein